MPAHASDFSLHMKGLFQTLLVHQETISEFCNSQCQTAVDELAREIAYPLYAMLAENLDNTVRYGKKSNIYNRLSAIWDLISFDDEEAKDADADADSTSLLSSEATTALGIKKERKSNNRTFLLMSTRCATLLSDILAKPELFTEAQLKMTLLLLRALFYSNETIEELGFDLKLKNVRLLFLLEIYSISKRSSK